MQFRFRCVRIFVLLAGLGLLPLLVSCMTAPLPCPTSPRGHSEISLPSHDGVFRRRDVVHTVAPGETVWRLAKMYDVPQQDILRANALRGSSRLRLGQRLRIPHAAPVRAVVPLYPSKKWKYIIIHHTATDEGNSLIFNRAHLRRGFDRGIGYHFVIDNGTCGKGDGQIEVTPRWLKQQDGAHCKADDMNRMAIGIALVGNFDKDRVSKRQMDSLVELVNLLRRYYHIPLNRIMGHGQVPGAATDCPGKKFPWRLFRKRLISG